MGNCVPTDAQSNASKFKHTNLNDIYIDELFISIIRIQKICRGYLARKKYKRLLLDKKDNDFIKKLHTYAIDFFKKKKIELKPFDYGDKKIDSIEKQIKSLQSPDTKIFYFGECLKSIRHGRGIQTWPDGSFYEGYWKYNKANNRGRLINSKGEFYDGEWLDDKAHGYGRYIDADGTLYEGEWKNEKQCGKGVETNKNGDKYLGDFADGKKNGRGKWIWRDGSEYEGEFENNEIHGKGIYKWRDGRKYEGIWAHNEIIGKSAFLISSSHKYEGNATLDTTNSHELRLWSDDKKSQKKWTDSTYISNGFGYNFYTDKKSDDSNHNFYK